MTHPLANFLAFQIGWFLTVFSAAGGVPWLGPVYAFVWVVLHLKSLGDDRRVELALLASAGALGFVADSVLVLSGVMMFPDVAQLGYPTTVWMVGLWVMFAATLRHALGWMRNRYQLAAFAGAMLGPLAYWAGAKLDALIMPVSMASGLAVATEWAIATPLLLWIMQALEHRAATNETEVYRYAGGHRR